MVILSKSENDTYELGFQMGCDASSGQVYVLEGDLGAGKTVFAAGFAKGMGIDTPICSPTFTILQVYEEGSVPLYHFDVYRIEDSSEMDEIGFDEYAFGDGICLIEWGSRIEDILPSKAVKINIERDPDGNPDDRVITVL